MSGDRERGLFRRLVEMARRARPEGFPDLRRVRRGPSGNRRPVLPQVVSLPLATVVMAALAVVVMNDSSELRATVPGVAATSASEPGMARGGSSASEATGTGAGGGVASTPKPTAASAKAPPASVLEGDGAPMLGAVGPAVPPEGREGVATAPGEAEGWRTYRNREAGYTVEYPAAWIVREAGPSASFIPPGGRVGIGVTVQLGGADDAGASDLGNVRCGSVEVASLSGTRCFDSIASAVTTTLVGEGESYTLSTSSKAANLGIYNRMLESLRVANTRSGTGGGHSTDDGPTR